MRYAAAAATAADVADADADCVTLIKRWSEAVAARAAQPRLTVLGHL